MNRHPIPQAYVFNHVPKTGGNSLLAICRRNLAGDAISPHLTEHEIRLWPADGLERYRLLTGHFSLLTQARLAASRYRITLLREPIRKILSTYQFWRITPDATPVTSIAKTRPFGEFVRYFAESPDVIHNPYTFHFAAVGRDCPAYPADERTLLAHAKRNLAAFDFVGITEQLGESVRVLCRELEWRCPPEIPRENASGSERLLDQVDGRTLELLAERNRLDLELYEYGRMLFRQTEAGIRRGGDRTLRPFPLPEAPARAAAIRSVSAVWSRRESVPALEIRIEFETAAEMEELAAGVLVHDAEGRVVWGTSTLAAGHRLRTAAGQPCRVCFVTDCEVPPGVYSVTAALSELRCLGLHHHWIDRAVCFEAERAGSGEPRPIRLRRLESGLGDTPPCHSVY